MIPILRCCRYSHMLLVYPEHFGSSKPVPMWRLWTPTGRSYHTRSAMPAARRLLRVRSGLWQALQKARSDARLTRFRRVCQGQKRVAGAVFDPGVRISARALNEVRCGRGI